MKTIAWLDFNLDNFHAAKFLELFRGPLAARGWQVGSVFALDEEGSRAWASENGVTLVSSPDELAPCDAAMVLAPGHPEHHLKLATQAFNLGVPVYVDKPLAESLDVASEIFRRADAKGVPVFTSSALRYGTGLTEGLASRGGKDAIEHIRVWGGSGSFSEYAIHSVEIMVSILGPNATEITSTSAGRQTMIHAEFVGGKSGTVFFHPHSDTHYQAMLSTARETSHVLCAGPTMFECLAGAVLDFFESGNSPVPREESLLIRRILDDANPGG